MLFRIVYLRTKPIWQTRFTEKWNWLRRSEREHFPTLTRYYLMARRDGVPYQIPLICDVLKCSHGIEQCETKALLDKLACEENFAGFRRTRCITQLPQKTVRKTEVVNTASMFYNTTNECVSCTVNKILNIWDGREIDSTSLFRALYQNNTVNSTGSFRALPKNDMTSDE